MKKILIIEDDLDIQELIQFFLEDQGYEVITASDGIDGSIDTDTIKQEDSYTKLTKVRKDNFR